MPERTAAEQEAVDDVGSPNPARVPAPRKILDGMMVTLAQGAATGRESATLVAGLSRIAIGRSEVGLGRDARVTDIATSAAAPINVLPGNPAALKKALDTGGRAW